MNTKHDYTVLEREYVTGDMSLRELARKHGISNHSVVVAQSKAREWVRKREEYRTGASEKAVVYMADAEGARRAREARVLDNAIEAIDEAIQKMRSDMKLTRKEMEGGEWVERPLFLVKPQDISMLLDRLNVLFNRPSQITEERSLGINLSSGGLSPDLLRGIVEATRGLGGPGDAASSPIPRADRAREN